MEDFPTKNKRRANRRKRNLVAKSLERGGPFQPRTIPPKKRREKVKLRELLEDLEVEEKEMERSIRDMDRGDGQS